MALDPVHLMTMQQYLQFERQAETKHEFYGGQIFDMSGAKLAHNRITVNLITMAGNQLRGGPCEVFGSDMRVMASEEMTAYPDLSIVCGNIEFYDPSKQDLLLNPVVIVEVLSPSTERYDRGVKFAHYRKIASLQEYLLVSQEEPRIERYRRTGAEQWLLTEAVGMHASFTLESVDVSLTLEEVYSRVVFTANGV